MKQAAFLLIPILTAGQVYAAGFTMPKAYTATMVTTSAGQTMSIKYYTDGTKMRSDSNAGGQSVESIIRPDKKLMYTVMVNSKMYMQRPLPATQQTPTATGPDAKFAKVGTETVDGHPCDKYSVTLNGKVSSYYSVDQKTNYLMKVASTDGKTVTIYKDFKVGTPPASTFEPPSGFKKM
jgi:hypothetical protein